MSKKNETIVEERIVERHTCFALSRPHSLHGERDSNGTPNSAAEEPAGAAGRVHHGPRKVRADLQGGGRCLLVMVKRSDQIQLSSNISLNVKRSDEFLHWLFTHNLFKSFKTPDNVNLII